MARVKRSVAAKKKRRETLERAKGFRGDANSHYKKAKEAVIKASAGVAYRASILRSQTVEDALQALQDAGFALYGLRGEAERTLYDGDFPARAAFLLGGESHGVSAEAGRWVHEWLRIPMAGGVESLNVSSAATVVAFELVRR